MQNEHIPSLNGELQAMARNGASVSQMLREIIRRSGTTHAHKTIVIRTLRNAFDLTLQEAAPISGWSDDGTGELTDERINELVMPEIVKRRRTWDRQTATA